MPRSPRLDIPGFPQHVVQRGNDRSACFRSSHDHGVYLGYLADAAEAHACKVHAYVLMTNHVHLLVTPAASGAVSRMMQALGRRYVCYFNHIHARTGTLWEGRFKASMVDTDHYLLACYRYIELNPVRAGMVAEPGSYAWSSYRTNAHGEASDLIVPHETYLALGPDPGACRDAYRQLFRDSLTPDRLDDIRHHLRQQKPLGGLAFRQGIATELGREVGLKPRGRPRRTP
ncbi:MAG: transposase [Luteibacter sp.]